MARKTTQAQTSAPAPAKSHYEVLGLNHRASTAEVKKAYQQIALDNHSDRLIALKLNDEAKAQADTLFIAANLAQEVLLDESLRKKYDHSLAMKGVAFGDRFGNTEAYVEDDEVSEDESEEEEEERVYAKVYQSSHAGLGWEDGILAFSSSGWDLQIQLDNTFADIVRGEISNSDTLHQELHLFIDIKRYNSTDYRKKGAANDENKRGKAALSLLITRTPQLRKLMSVRSELTWGEDDQETLYVVFELWHPSADHKHSELEFADLDVDVCLDFPIEEAKHVAERDSGGKKNKKTGYAALSLQQLKALCRERGLQMSGGQKDIIERLEEDDAGEKQKTRKKKAPNGLMSTNAAHVTAGSRMANQRSKCGMGMRR